MVKKSGGDMSKGSKVLIDGQPHVVVLADHVSPGKGSAFVRLTLKHLSTGKLLKDYTMKADASIESIDHLVEEKMLSYAYNDRDDAVFVDNRTYDQVSVPMSLIGDKKKWLKEESNYHIIFYDDSPIAIEPPQSLILKVIETETAVKGDTSGNVLKEATVEGGAKVKVQLFINVGDMIKVTTETGESQGRVTV